MAGLPLGVKNRQRVTPGVFRTTEGFERRYGALHRFRVAAEDEADLKHWSREFRVDAPLETVFRSYLTVHPAAVWPREIITYQFAFAPGSDVKILAGDVWPVAAIGTKVFVDLRIRPVSLKVMTGVELTRLAPNEELRYDYLEGCTNHGYNSVLFRAAADGSEVTHIHHVTRWKAPDRLMALFMPLLYETNHGGFVSGYHTNMKRHIESALD